MCDTNNNVMVDGATSMLALVAANSGKNKKQKKKPSHADSDKALPYVFGV